MRKREIAPDSPIGLRADEEASRNAFHRFLEGQACSTSITWRQGEDPPDSYVAFGGNEYPVEMTSVVEQHLVGKKPISRVGLHDSLMRFVKRVEDTARQKGLHGWYIVSAWPTGDFLGMADELKRKILDYVDTTRHQVTSEERHLLGRWPDRWTISKIGTQHDAIQSVPTTAKWVAEGNEELPELLHERLSSKKDTLSHLAPSSIVLLADRHLFADPQGWAYAASKCKLVPEFHTVARISNMDCQVLFSRNHNWVTQLPPED